VRLSALTLEKDYYMLLFSSETFTVDGITVFPDHSDPNQFWYLPGPVGLAKLPDSDEPQFLLTMFAEDVAASGVQGGGFLNVTLALVPSDATKSKIMGQIRTQFADASDPRLAPVAFDEGTVQIVMLDLQGGGGTTAAPAPPSTFQAVQQILGAVTPELFGDNDALFGVKLSEAGATILEQAFEDGMAPVGGIYNLKFTGVLPALNVKITADMKRIYTSFSVGLEAKVYWVSAGIEATFEKLRQDGAIKVEIVNLSTSASVEAEEQWALNLFKDQILSTWFAPSLSPTTAQAASVTMPTLGATGGAAGGGGAKTPTPTGGAAGGMTAGGMHTPTPTAGSSGAKTGMQQPASTHGGSSKPAAASATPTTTPGAAPAGTPPASAAAPAAPAPAGAAPTLAAAKSVAPAAGAPAANPLGQAANPIAKAAGTAAAASSAASPFGVALQLKYVSQDELKTVSIEYNSMDAVQRTYSPQGYFGLALQGLAKSKHFLKVDGSDVFFNRFIVTGNPPKDFAGIGLLSAHAALDYGDPSGPQPPKHGEFLFDGSSTAAQTWPVFEGLIQETAYTYTADYKFDPESGWQGEQTSYTQAPVKTDNRVLNLDPYDFLGFLNISVSPGRIDANLIDRIDVMLQYTAKSGWQTSTTITVRPDSKPQSWKLRVTDKNDPVFKYASFTYSTTCYLKDGTTFQRGPVTSDATAILVSDPFSSALDLLLQPAFDPAATQLGIIELSYTDKANNYSFQNSYEIPGTTNTPTKVHIPLIDPTLREYQYRVTLLGVGNQKTPGTYITATDPLVLVTV
jgi:hypothetical protein